MNRPQPVVEIVERRVEAPASLLTCMPEPRALEVWRTQGDVALYLVRLAEPVRTAEPSSGPLRG